MAAPPPADVLAERVARCAADALPVLLAEDSRANQLVATGILGQAGFRVDVVENGLQAVSAVGQTRLMRVYNDDLAAFGLVGAQEREALVDGRGAQHLELVFQQEPHALPRPLLVIDHQHR